MVANTHQIYKELPSWTQIEIIWKCFKDNGIIMWVASSGNQAKALLRFKVLICAGIC